MDNEMYELVNSHHDHVLSFSRHNMLSIKSFIFTPEAVKIFVDGQRLYFLFWTSDECLTIQVLQGFVKRDADNLELLLAHRMRQLLNKERICQLPIPQKMTDIIRHATLSDKGCQFAVIITFRNKSHFKLLSCCDGNISELENDVIVKSYDSTHEEIMELSENNITGHITISYKNAIIRFCVVGDSWSHKIQDHVQIKAINDSFTPKRLETLSVHCLMRKIGYDKTKLAQLPISSAMKHFITHILFDDEKYFSVFFFVSKQHPIC